MPAFAGMTALSLSLPATNAERLREAIDASKRGAVDCFAEPVIGRRFAPTRWLAMTGVEPYAAGCSTLSSLASK
jgi:hypothetical protein